MKPAETTFDFQDGKGPVLAHRHENGGGWVANSAFVDSTTFIEADARVSGNARVYGNARVSEVCTRTPKFLSGFKHHLTITDHHVRAGCECHPPSVWIDRGEAIIRSDGASAKDAKAQAAIIAALIEQHGCTDPEESK